MPSLMIKDYLRTQGLTLAPDAVEMAYLTAQAVINVGAAEIERTLLWYRAADGVALADSVADNAENHAVLRQIYLALDSLLTRLPSQSAAVYLNLPIQAQPHGGKLLRLVAQGRPMEAVLAVGGDAALFHLASRSAQTGWLNLVDDAAHWLAQGELKGDRHARCQSQMALPLYGGNGRVLGVVYVEDAQTVAFDAERQAHWIGLTLALLPLLQQLHSAWDTQHANTEKHHE